MRSSSSPENDLEFPGETSDLWMFHTSEEGVRASRPVLLLLIQSQKPSGALTYVGILQSAGEEGCPGWMCRHVGVLLKFRLSIFNTLPGDASAAPSHPPF